MADPVPIDALKAASMKSAAGKAATQAPGTNSQSNAVQQDLAVMADLSRGYTAGAVAGNQVAEQNRQAQGSRLAQERSQADAARSRALDMERLQGDLAQAKIASQQQSDALTLADAQRGLADSRALAPLVAPEADPLVEAQKEAYTEDVLMRLNREADAATRSAVQTVLNLGPRTPEEAIQIFDNLASEDPALAAADRRAVERFIKDFDLADQGKDPAARQAKSRQAVNKAAKAVADIRLLGAGGFGIERAQ